MRNFEYSLLQNAEPDATNIREFLNERGSQGWELVQIVPNTKQGWIYVFKREFSANNNSDVLAAFNAAVEQTRATDQITLDDRVVYTLSEHGDLTVYKLAGITNDKDLKWFAAAMRMELCHTADLSTFQCECRKDTTLRDYVRTLADMLDD